MKTNQWRISFQNMEKTVYKTENQSDLMKIIDANKITCMNSF